jgi:ribonucleoside-diphosphate reductase alpha chain
VEGALDAAETAKLRALGYTGELTPTTRLSGWQMCNLSTINGAVLQNADDFYVACIHAAVIGTLQASYTDIPYLGPVTRYLNERDALLGVSVCGFMDNPEILFNPEVLERGARLCRAANEIIAGAIGIRPAARVTCVKPEGTASLLLGAASGIHPHHARHYFRRVQANRKDPVYRHFAASNPHMTEASVYRPEVDDVITFAVEAPPHAILREEVNAVEFLQFVQLVQRHWVLAGEMPVSRSPGLHHNVSNTCTVKSSEWDAVAKFIWENRALFTGVSLLAHDGDKRYAQAPREAVLTDDDVAKWNRLRYNPVTYTALKEKTDETALKEVVACAGGSCELT